MPAEAQILTILNILVALHLSRALYKSTLFMQNKAILPDAQMKVSSVLTKDYENDNTFRLPENKPNQTQSCPPKHQRRRIQTQPLSAPKTPQYSHQMRKFALIIEGRVLFEPLWKSKIVSPEDL